MPYSTRGYIFNPIDYLSYTSFYIETYVDEHRVSQGTAFCYDSGEKIYLVSNWHMFSGKNPNPDSNGIYQPSNIYGAIPNYVKASIYGWDSNNQKHFGVGTEVLLPLLDSKNNPLYLSRQLNNGEYIDIACLPFDIDKSHPYWKGLGNPLCVNTVYPEKFLSEYILHPTDDVYILGYPFGKLKDQYLPIWKRGSIASATLYAGYKTYVDTATKSGMSGSPVFHIHKDEKSFFKYREQIINEERIYKTEFIGIYSGRIIENNTTKEDSKIIKDCDLLPTAQLGIIWNKSALESIISPK